MDGKNDHFTRRARNADERCIDTKPSGLTSTNPATRGDGAQASAAAAPIECPTITTGSVVNRGINSPSHAPYAEKCPCEGPRAELSPGWPGRSTRKSRLRAFNAQASGKDVAAFNPEPETITAGGNVVPVPAQTTVHWPSDVLKDIRECGTLHCCRRSRHQRRIGSPASELR